jgi:hypothetical protein
MITFKMEAAGSCEMLITTYVTALGHYPKDHNLYADFVC